MDRRQDSSELLAPDLRGFGDNDMPTGHWSHGARRRHRGVYRHPAQCPVGLGAYKTEASATQVMAVVTVDGTMMSRLPDGEADVRVHMDTLHDALLLLVNGRVQDVRRALAPEGDRRRRAS